MYLVDEQAQASFLKQSNSIVVTSLITVGKGLQYALSPATNYEQSATQHHLCTVTLCLQTTQDCSGR